MKLAKLVGLTAALFLTAPGHAANWVYVDKSVRYFDAKSILRLGRSVTVWEKVDYSQDNTMSLRDLKVRQKYDCARRTVKMIMWVLHYKDGGSEIREVPLAEQTERQIIPDTPPEPILEAVCAFK